MHRQLDSQPQIDTIILAAGKGKRMQQPGNKMFLELKGVPVIYRTLCRLNRTPRIRRLVVVIRKEEKQQFSAMIQTFGGLEKISAFVEGGAERYESVRKGLAYLAQHSDSEIVMTHDGARPFVTEKLIQNLSDSLEQQQIAIPVQKVSETVRQLETGNRTRIIDRDQLYLTQTPQMFFAEDIEPCFLSKEQAGKGLTDEAGYFEELGRSVELIEGDKRNIKITTPEDLVWAEYLLEKHTDLQLTPYDR